MPNEEKDKIQIGIYRIDKSLFEDSTIENISQTIIEKKKWVRHVCVYEK